MTTPTEGPIAEYDPPDEAISLESLNSKLDRILDGQERLNAGVNTIGTMMNEVANAFGQVMEKVNQGGIGALMGMMGGGKKNG